MKKQQKITTQKKPIYKNYDYLGKRRQTDLSPQPQRSSKALEEERLLANKTSTRIGFYLSIAALGIVGATLAVFLFWSLEKDTVLEIKNSPVPVRPTQIDNDEYILLHYDYCKYSDAVGTVESQLVSKTAVLPLPTVKDKTDANCKEFDAPYPVPGQAAPETYHYHFKACYPINPIKTTCTEWNSKTFEIKGEEIERDIQVKNIAR